MTKRIEVLLFSLLALLLILAPLFRSGNTPEALFFLESLALLILAIALWQPSFVKHLSKGELLLLIFIIIVPIIYLLPLPDSLLKNVSGRELYSELNGWVDSLQGAGGAQSLSLIPTFTEKSLLVLLLPLAVFIGVKCLPFNKVKTLLIIFLWIAALEAILSLLQYPNGAESIFYLGMERVGHSGQGTYFNRDHFAALMEMSLPFAIALLAYNFSSSGRANKSVFNTSVIFFTLTLLLLMAAIFTKSRSGVALVLLGVFLSTIAFSGHIGGKQTAGFSVVMTGLFLGIGTSIGLIPVLNRFIAADPLKDARKEIFETTFVGIQQFWPFGSGSGTFPQIYRSFQSVDRTGFVNHVHNDYLELLFEVGIFAVIGFAVYVALYIYQLWKLRLRRWSKEKFIQVAAGVGIFLVLLHSLTDFNLHVVANLIFFSFLNAVYFHPMRNR